MEYFSHSKVKSYRRCPKSFEYKYIQGLSRKTAPGALTRGVVFHEMLDNTVMGKDWREPLEAYRKVYDRLWDEEKEAQSHPDELESLYHRYQKFWKNDGLQYNNRSEIEVQCEHRGLRFKGIIDKIVTTSEGLVFVCDHKTHRVIPDENARFSDIQTVLYYWALQQNGEQVDGVLWDYIRTKPPTAVEVLKKGGLTRRANLDTDEATYMKAILDNGLDPNDYQEELAKARRNVFFKRVYLPRPSEGMVREVVNDFFDTAEEILNAKKFPRNMTRDCKSCTYYSICSLEVRGLDSDLTRKQMFNIREAT